MSSNDNKRATIPAILPASDAVIPGKIYKPSEDYEVMSDLELKDTSKKLLVLDLNGTLLSRINPKENFEFLTRPYADVFFNYIFKHFEVMVWSTAQKSTVNKICSIFSDYPLVLKWHRGHFGFNNAEYYSKVEGIKNLERVWKELPQYNVTNTIVVDDTPIKLSLQPYNLIKISTFHHCDEYKDSDNMLLQLIDYLELVKDEPNIAFYMKRNPFVDSKITSKSPITSDSSGQRKRPHSPPLPLTSSLIEAKMGRETKKKKKKKKGHSLNPKNK